MNITKGFEKFHNKYCVLEKKKKSKNRTTTKQPLDYRVNWTYWFEVLQLQLQLYTAKSQYWLHKAGASPEHWQFKINNLLMKV